MGFGDYIRSLTVLGTVTCAVVVASPALGDERAASTPESTSAGDEAERQAVEAWVKADIERALKFFESPPNLEMSFVAEQSVPATPEQDAARIERLASLKKLIDGKPDHPMRDEYDRLLVYAPGASLLANVYVWIGKLDDRFAWRWSQTPHTDARSASTISDYASDGTVRWSFTGSTFSVYPAHDSQPLGSRDIVIATAGDLLFGWFGISVKPVRPKSIEVTWASDKWRCILAIDAEIRVEYSIAWNHSTQQGFVLERIHRMGDTELRVLRDPETTQIIGSGLAASHVTLLNNPPDVSQHTVSHVNSLRVRTVDQESFAQAVRLPPTQSEGGDILRGPIEALRVADRRPGMVPEGFGSVPWSPEVRAALLSGNRSIAEFAENPALRSGKRQFLVDSSYRWLLSGATVGVIIVFGMLVRKYFASRSAS